MGSGCGCGWKAPQTPREAKGVGVAGEFWVGGARGGRAGTVEGGNKKEKTRSARLGATHVGKESASEAKQDMWVTSGCPAS